MLTNCAEKTQHFYPTRPHRHGYHCLVGLLPYRPGQEAIQVVVRGEDGDVRIKKEWGHVVEKYPNNFMRGSDVVGDFHNYHKIIRKYNALLKALAPKTRRNVGHSARRIGW